MSEPNKGQKLPRHAPACLIGCAAYGGTQFTSELTKACLERLGVSRRFHCPYNPRAAGLFERSNATLK
jgi:hypothetical protein